MSKENLKLAEQEINQAILIARDANSSVDDISSVDADVFRQIERPLRRALRLVKPKQEERCTLSLEYSSDEATQREVEEWTIDGHIYGEMILRLQAFEPEHPFMKAFEEIFTKHLLNRAPFGHIMGQLFPLIVLSLQGFEPANACELVEVLRTLRETLAPELVKKIQDNLKLD